MRLGLRHTTKASLGLFLRTNAMGNHAQRAMITVLRASLRDGQFLSICPYSSIYGLFHSTGHAAEGKAISFATIPDILSAKSPEEVAREGHVSPNRPECPGADADARPRCCLLTITFYCLQSVALIR